MSGHENEPSANINDASREYYHKKVRLNNRYTEWSDDNTKLDEPRVR
jgi:hypothetical protein